MESITNWITNNQELMISFGIKLVVAIVILIVGKLVARLVSKGVSKILEHKSVDQAVISFVASLVYGIGIAIVFIIAISHLGFNTSSLVAIVGAAGLAVGLALQGSLSNFASGVLLISFRPFKAGDFVEVGGVAGIVEEILIFSTKLRTGDNKTVIIPNGAITSGTITNYSTKPTRRIDLVIGVSYDANLADARKVLADVVAADERVLKDPAVTIGVSELADSAVNIVVRPWVKSANYWPTYFDLMENIKVALDQANIEIPYPQVALHMNKEDQNES
ncbi:mechanosensitive ion channel family protein [Thalassotalea euphylliae]|uniref:Small-conductance mechanosensitive channel n=1 Tax=Thalassotalea euphylliae TaxID=1655234 RepID=A0A3E0TTU1_9GAMM|nr:mechanosensitive ion channel domain-containing protein [Thalassotalea euphylliae]REL27860.1 mechanosensitive ion channel family protein [Thalassotalea euphylliae]